MEFLQAHLSVLLGDVNIPKARRSRQLVLHRCDFLSNLVEYRRVFDYRTRHVDFGAEAPPLPECLAGVLRAMAVRRLKPDSPDQLTLNEYKP